jgi:uncharacterized membrane protein YkvA (DUF1232 family)
MNPLTRLIALMRDPRTPKLPRFLVIAAMIYTLSPIDLIPEAIVTPLLGYLDDLMLLWLSTRWLFKKDPHVTVEPVDVTPPRPPASLPPAPRQ